jgi:hypothetical protein
MEEITTIFHRIHQIFFPTIRFTTSGNLLGLLGKRSKVFHGVEGLASLIWARDTCLEVGTRDQSTSHFASGGLDGQLDLVDNLRRCFISTYQQLFCAIDFQLLILSYAGWLSNNSVPNWQGDPVATSSLIKFEYDGGVWLNSTGPDNTPRVEGVMVYIPASEGGLLIYFGGATVPYGNDTLVESSMDTIYLYDIASARWYTQTAFGDVPASRRRFCAGAAWAPDQSSYNM